jgi:hypothetical protein
MRKILFAGLFLAVASCYPGDVTTLSELDVVVSFENPESNYSALMTYSIPDTVVQIDEDSSNIQISHDFDSDIVNRVKSRLNDYGWTEVAFPADTPDVFVFASVVADTYTSYSYTPGYWWGYWGWYYPPCYYCYPGYPGYITSTKFDAGTLFLDMIETASFSPADSTVRFAWTAAMGGVLSSSSSSNANRALAGIDQAFLQSAYLEK